MHAMSPSSQPRERPSYWALDAQGREYQRPARVIAELPHAQRSEALREATAQLASMSGLRAVKTIPAGAPAFTAFEGLNRPLARRHPMAGNLLKSGEALALDLVPSYNA